MGISTYTMLYYSCLLGLLNLFWSRNPNGYQMPAAFSCDWNLDTYMYTHTFLLFTAVLQPCSLTLLCFLWNISKRVLIRTDPGLLAHLFTSGIPSQCSTHTQTKTWGLFMKVQHPQLLLWKVISRYCSNTVIRGPEAERSQQLPVPVILLPSSSPCTLEDWAEFPQVPVQAALDFPGQQHGLGGFQVLIIRDFCCAHLYCWEFGIIKAG